MQSPLAISQKLLVLQTTIAISSFQHAKTTRLVRLKIDITDANMANGFLAVETRQGLQNRASRITLVILLSSARTKNREHPLPMPTCQLIYPFMGFKK